MLSSKVWKKFTDFNMKPWTDSHHVRLHVRPPKGTNAVTFRNKTFSEPGYLAYSPSGTAQVCVLCFALIFLLFLRHCRIKS